MTSRGEQWCWERIQKNQLKYQDGKILLWHTLHKRWIEKTVCYRDDTGNGRGYLKFGTDRLKVYAHRLVWIITNNSLPSEGMQVDHIDGDKGNNDPSNLRLLTENQNTSKGGHKGLDERAEAIGRWFEFVGTHGGDPETNEEILYVETGF